MERFINENWGIFVKKNTAVTVQKNRVYARIRTKLNISKQVSIKLNEQRMNSCILCRTSHVMDYNHILSDRDRNAWMYERTHFVRIWLSALVCVCSFVDRNVDIRFRQTGLRMGWIGWLWTVNTIQWTNELHKYINLRGRKQNKQTNATDHRHGCKWKGDSLNISVYCYSVLSHAMELYAVCCMHSVPHTLFICVWVLSIEYVSIIIGESFFH